MPTEPTPLSFITDIFIAKHQDHNTGKLNLPGDVHFEVVCNNLVELIRNSEVHSTWIAVLSRFIGDLTPYAAVTDSLKKPLFDVIDQLFTRCLRKNEVVASLNKETSEALIRMCPSLTLLPGNSILLA